MNGRQEPGETRGAADAAASPAGSGSSDGHFARRVAIAVTIASLAFLFWELRHVAVTGFAAVVVAALLAGVADLVRQILPVGHRVALSLGSLLLVVLVIAAGVFVWPQIHAQAGDFLEMFNRSIADLQERTGFSFESMLDEIRDGGGTGMVGRVFSDVFSFAGTVASAVTGIVLVVVAGAFLAIQPGLYRNGLVRLVPPAHQDRARVALDRTGRGLKLWLVGQGVSMLIIGVFVGLGAWMIGLPSPLVLGLISGLAEFVPLVGPFIAALVGLLFAFSAGNETFLWTLGLYLVVQQLESNVITPYVQRQAVSVPPALFMLSVLAMGTLFGVVGVVLSGPLTVAAFVLIRSIYLEGALGEELESAKGI